MKRLVQESIYLLNVSLWNKFEMKRNREYLMKTLDVLDGNVDKLREKMNVTLKQLTVGKEKIDVLDNRMVQRAEYESRSFEEMENFYRQNVSEESIRSSMAGYRKVSGFSVFSQVLHFSRTEPRHQIIPQP